MNKLIRDNLLDILKLFDVIIVIASFVLTVFVFLSSSETVGLGSSVSLRITIMHIVLFSVFLILCHFIMLSSGLYQSRRFSTRWQESIDVLKATTVMTLLMVLADILFAIKLVDTPFVATFWGISSFLLIQSRVTIRLLLKWLRIKGRNLRFMLIIGTNKRAIRLAEAIERKPEMGYRLIGFIDKEWGESNYFQQTGYPLVADFNTFIDFIRSNVVDEVVVCLPLKSLYDEIHEIISDCEVLGITVRFISSPFDLKHGKIRTEEFEGRTIISIHTGAAINFQQAFLKDLLDISISLILIVILIPLFLCVAVLIKLTSPGPIFFIQDRIGINKRLFKLYKFRTMVNNAEQVQSELESLNEASGPVFKIKNDPRITLLGKFLRKTGIDELPQLFNVIKREMSLVGPRPLPVRDYNGFDKDWHRRRFSVRPGITCLWQVNGRHRLSFEEWMTLDMNYIDQWSLWLDVKILAKTIPAVIRGGAS